MRLRIEYVLIFQEGNASGLKLPLSVPLDGALFEVGALEENGRQAAAVVHGPVDPNSLSVRLGPESFAGEEPDRMVFVPENEQLRAFMDDMINLVSFLADVPTRFAIRGKSLIAESEGDKEVLRALGTTVVYSEFHAIGLGRSFSSPALTQEDLRILLSRREGLALYSRAILPGDEVAQFRELWRILEAAFREKGARLVNCLAAFEPAKAMDFTRPELEKLLTLRGRASHAYSKAGMSEIASVRAEVSLAFGRLKCLCEQVILAKANWGDGSVTVARLAPLRGYVNSKGGHVLHLIARTDQTA